MCVSLCRQSDPDSSSFDLVEGCVYKDTQEVKTKFSKRFTTYFFPVGDEIRKIVAERVWFLREEKLCGNDDPPYSMGIEAHYAAPAAPSVLHELSAIGSLGNTVRGA